MDAETGIVMLVKPLHPLNAFSPILYTSSDISTLVNPLHALNALSVISHTPASMTIEIVLLRAAYHGVH